MDDAALMNHGETELFHGAQRGEYDGIGFCCGVDLYRNRLVSWTMDSGIFI